jgi:hypothetical protein
VSPVQNPGQSKLALPTGDTPVAHTPKAHEQGDAVQLVGRTICDRIVVFDGNLRQVGRTVPVSIYDANAHTMFGTVVTQHVGPELFTLGV